jgi:hypothetical protein
MSVAPQYRDLMSAIIRRFIVIVGSRTALETARRVPGVTVTDGGTVTSVVDLAALTTLVAEYKKIGGTLSVHFMRREVAQLVEGSSLVLPEDLK